MKIIIHESKHLYAYPDEYNSRPTERAFLQRFSSSYTYDMALSGIFPYYALVTQLQGQELSGLISMGYPGLGGGLITPSFALVLNDRGNKFNRNKVLWLSQAAYTCISRHEDLYDITLSEDFATMYPAEEGE
jgi:hypothetical protein